MRPRSPIRGCLTGGLLAWGVLCCPPLSAEPPFDEIDGLSDSSTDERAGIDLAAMQAERGELLEALATLERVLAAFPKSREALFVHAVFLCRTDDLRGGQIELGRLRKKDYDRELFAMARTRCGLED